jgi:hypothetical protein
MKTLYIVGIVMLVIGIISLIVGIILGTAIQNVIKNKIENNLIIEQGSTTSKSYNHWLYNNYSTATPIYFIYNLWNLTNADQVSKGEKPIYESVGPYYYREFEYKFNVTFTNNGDQVTYKEFDFYIFDQNLSGPGVNPFNDIIININPAYVGVMVETNGESNLIYSFYGTTLGELLGDTLFNSSYYELALFYNIAPVLNQNFQNITLTLNASVHNISNATLLFYEEWANGTANIPNIYPYFMQIKNITNYTSNISFDSAQKNF